MACVYVHMRTWKELASRLFDYEWSMQRQQNAQRTMPDTQLRANSDLVWSRLAVIPSLCLCLCRSHTAVFLRVSLERPELSSKLTGEKG